MKLYNTLTRQIDDFKPINHPHVKLYVCGVTVYDHCHMGHARAYVCFDVLKRVLTHQGYTVNHVQNFTDIDDKIIKRSIDTNTPWQDLTKKFIDSYNNDMASLNILPANIYPKATEYVSQMIDLIETLIQKKSAYQVNGSVYFKVSSCSDYGKLSRKSMNDQSAGQRVDIDTDKESPFDFILWKPAKPNEPSWPSPWGAGRPGWHTECVAMIHHTLGSHIDIHGGGADLQFPHHENEMAQGCCAFDTPLANVWVHNGFVTVNNEKMSKSLNNFFTLRDVLAHYEADVLRFFLMRTHYRQPLNYSPEALNDAKAAYTKLTSVLTDDFDTPIPNNLTHLFEDHRKSFWNALTHDLGISSAIAALFSIQALIKTHQCGATFLKDLGQTIGLFYMDHSDKNTTQPNIPDDIHHLAKQRWEAKQNKQFALADELRSKIESSGFYILDSATDYRIESL